MNDYEQNFYSLIGLISIRFAKLENAIIEMISILINSDDNIISLTLIENNSLSQNLVLLLKINRSRDFEEDQIILWCKKIDNIRINRNLFIHGIWSQIMVSEGKTFIYCEEKKLRYSKLKRGKQWEYNRHIKYSIESLKKEIIQIEKCIIDAEDLLKKLDDYEF